MSIWNEKIKNEKILNENKEVETLIIGAGITGLTTAYYLREAKSLCIVEANKIGHGVTLNTTAKINYFQERNYTKIKNMTSDHIATSYLNSQRDAIVYLKDIIEQEHISCQLEKVKSYVFANKKSEVEPLIKEVEFLKNNNIKVKKEKLPCNTTSYLSFFVEDTYIFHPLKYLNGITDILKKNGVSIYENTPIVKIEKEGDYYKCYSDKYEIKAKNIVLACHYPFFLYPFFLPLKSYIEKSYVIISKTNIKDNYTCISSSNPTYSCRFYENNNQKYQISLGQSHNTSIKQDDEKHFKEVKKMFHLKEKDIIMRYTNVDIMSADLMPYIGSIRENMFLATGYNTWGMTNSVLAAKMISDTILNKTNLYSSLFHPKRKNMISYLKIPYHVASQVKSYLGPKLNKNKPWYPDNVYFFNEDGKSLATYIDKNGEKHTIYNKCPHLGCSLIFNKVEKTWDCPCHSSRFTMDGVCIKGPSLKDISYHKK